MRAQEKLAAARRRPGNSEALRSSSAKGEDEARLAELILQDAQGRKAAHTKEAKE